MIRTQGLEWVCQGGPHLRFEDVSVGQGGCLLLTGPSGCGKSSWISMVAGLRRPTAGRLEVAACDLAGLRSSALDAWRARHVGMVAQRLHLSAALTVHDNLALAYYATGMTPDPGAIRRMLGRLGIAELAARRPASLSGGQAQRVAIARALLMAPRVLLADEPTASLDDAAAHAAVALLHEVAGDSGATLVVATHDARARAALESRVPSLVRLEMQAIRATMNAGPGAEDGRPR